MNHIDDETLIAYYFKNLNKKDLNEVKNHLSQCDRCYKNYAVLSASLSELKKVKYIRTPKKMLNLAYRELNIKEPERVLYEHIKGVLVMIKDAFDSLSEMLLLKPVYMTALATAVLIIVVTVVFNPFSVLSEKTEKQPSIPIKIRQRISIPTKIETESKITGLKVFLRDSNLVLTQPTHFERTVYLYDNHDNHIKTFQFTKPREIISLSEIPATDSITVIIETMDTIVYKSKMKL